MENWMPTPGEIAFLPEVESEYVAELGGVPPDLDPKVDIYVFGHPVVIYKILDDGRAQIFGLTSFNAGRSRTFRENMNNPRFWVDFFAIQPNRNPCGPPDNWVRLEGGTQAMRKRGWISLKMLTLDISYLVPSDRDWGRLTEDSMFKLDFAAQHWDLGTYNMSIADAQRKRAELEATNGRSSKSHQSRKK